MKPFPIISRLIATNRRRALAVIGAACFASATAVAQSGSLQITPDPPRVAPPPLQPPATMTRAPMPPDYLSKRTPQFEIWRSGDTVPFRPAFQLQRTDSIPVRVASGDVFAVRLFFLALPAGSTVFMQAAGHLQLIDSPDGQPVKVTTDANGSAVVMTSFAQTGRDGAIVARVDGVQTGLRLRRNSP